MGKKKSAPVSVKAGTPDDGESEPKSFIALWHWCEPWSSVETSEADAWEPAADGLGRTIVAGYASPRKPEFLRLATKHLKQLGDDIEVTKLEKLPDASLTSLVHAVQRRCERGAESKGELPPGWFAQPAEGLSVPLPPLPLRESDDLSRWLKIILDDSGRLDAKQRLHPAHGLRLWTFYRQARFWIDQKRPDIQLPLVPTTFDAAMKWWGNTSVRAARQPKDFPECAPAEQALDELLRLVEPTPPAPRQVASTFDVAVSVTTDASQSWNAAAAQLKAENVKRQDRMREAGQEQERKDRLDRAVERVRAVCSRPDMERTDSRSELAARLLDLASCCRDIGFTDRVNQLKPETPEARCAVGIFEAAVAGDSDTVERRLQEAGEGFPPASLIDITNILGDIGWTLWHGRTLERVVDPVTRQDDETTGARAGDFRHDVLRKLDHLSEGMKELAAQQPADDPSSGAKPVDPADGLRSPGSGVNPVRTSVALRWFVHELRGLVYRLESAANDPPELVDGEFSASVSDHARELCESAVRFDEVSDDEIRRLEPSERVREVKRILRQMLGADEPLSITLYDYAVSLRKCLDALPPVDAPTTIPPAASSSGSKPGDVEHDSAVTDGGTKPPDDTVSPPTSVMLSDAELAELAGCVTKQTLEFVRFLRTQPRPVFWSNLPNECWRTGVIPQMDSVETALERARDQLAKIYNRWRLILKILPNETVQLIRPSS